MVKWWNRNKQPLGYTDTLNQTRPKTETKTIEIKITLPTLPSSTQYAKISKKLSKVSPKTLVILGLIFLVAVVSYSRHQQTSTQTIQTTSVSRKTNTTRGLVSGTPEYKTVLPGEKSIESLGGWTRVSPLDKNPVFAYVDKIGDIPINVSQQPLPEDFKNDTAVQIEQLAQGFKANEKITVGDSVVHIGTSSKGPQSVIFNKKDLLILIKSSVQVNNDQWAEYINSLK